MRPLRLSFVVIVITAGALLAASPNAAAQTRSATPAVTPDKARVVGDIKILQVARLH